MDSKKYTALIGAELVPALLNRSDVVLFDCRFDLMDPSAGESAYHKAHLERAIYAHLDRDLSSPITPESGRHPLPDRDKLITWLSHAGVDQSKQVVIYDAQGGLFAARLWWLLRWLGHDAVAVINGGFQAAVDQGVKLSQEIPEPLAANFVPSSSLEQAVSTEELVQIQLLGSRKIVDVRATERYRGEVEPIDPVAGHIPGAINIPLNCALNEHNCYRSQAELKAIYSEHLGSYQDHQPILMCGSGVTACHSRLAIEAAGLPAVAIYPGSWSEWIRDPMRPVTTGQE